MIFVQEVELTEKENKIIEDYLENEGDCVQEWERNKDGELVSNKVWNILCNKLDLSDPFEYSEIEDIEIEDVEIDND